MREQTDGSIAPTTLRVSLLRGLPLWLLASAITLAVPRIRPGAGSVVFAVFGMAFWAAALIAGLMLKIEISDDRVRIRSHRGWKDLPRECLGVRHVEHRLRYSTETVTELFDKRTGKFVAGFHPGLFRRRDRAVLDKLMNSSPTDGGTDDTGPH